MKYTYLVVFEKCAEGWKGIAPDVPDVASLDGTLDDSRNSLRTAISTLIEDRLDRFAEVPPSDTVCVDFAEFNPDPLLSRFVVEWITINAVQPGTVTLLNSAQ